MPINDSSCFFDVASLGVGVFSKPNVLVITAERVLYVQGRKKRRAAYFLSA